MGGRGGRGKRDEGWGMRGSLGGGGIGRSGVVQAARQAIDGLWPACCDIKGGGGIEGEGCQRLLKSRTEVGWRVLAAGIRIPSARALHSSAVPHPKPRHRQRPEGFEPQEFSLCCKLGMLYVARRVGGF